VLLAGIELDAGKLQDGLADLDKAIEWKVDSVGPYITRSVLLAETGQTAKAEEGLAPLLARFTKDDERAITYRALAWVKYNQQKYEAARSYLRQSAQLEPNSPETLYLTGLTYLAERHPEAALSFVRGSLNQKPGWAEGEAVAGQIAGAAGLN